MAQMMNLAGFLRRAGVPDDMTDYTMRVDPPEGMDHGRVYSPDMIGMLRDEFNNNRPIMDEMGRYHEPPQSAWQTWVTPFFQPSPPPPTIQVPFPDVSTGAGGSLFGRGLRRNQGR